MKLNNYIQNSSSIKIQNFNKEANTYLLDFLRCIQNNKTYYEILQHFKKIDLFIKTVNSVIDDKSRKNENLCFVREYQNFQNNAYIYNTVIKSDDRIFETLPDVLFKSFSIMIIKYGKVYEFQLKLNMLYIIYTFYKNTWRYIDAITGNYVFNYNIFRQVNIKNVYDNIMNKDITEFINEHPELENVFNDNFNKHVLYKDIDNDEPKIITRKGLIITKEYLECYYQEGYSLNKWAKAIASDNNVSTKQATRWLISLGLNTDK